MSAPRRSRTVGVLLGALLLVVACQADDEGAGDVFDLAVGDCFEEPATGAEITQVGVVDCEEAHDAEVFETLRFDEPDEYPGQEAVVATAEARCIEAFEGYVGVGFDASRLDLGTLVPSEASWGDGDREVVCYLAAPPGEQLQGTMRGSGE